MKHYIKLDGIFYQHYAYFDLNQDQDYVADSLFYKREIPVKFLDEMVKDDGPYRLIFCKIKKKYIEKFEEALEEIPSKMSLLGHNDYEEYCINLFKQVGLEDGISD